MACWNITFHFKFPEGRWSYSVLINYTHHKPKAAGRYASENCILKLIGYSILHGIDGRTYLNYVPEGTHCTMGSSHLFDLVIFDV
jgi:hypothetical protein